MFDIEYKGGNAVVITTKKDQLVADPKLSVVGLKDIKTKDVVELATEERFAVRTGDEKVVIEGPGEYEVSDFSIRGVAATRHIDTPESEKLASIYRIEIGELKIALFGNIQPTVSEDQLEQIGVVDILILPVGGGGYTLDATSAAALVRQVESKVVIPVHYADGALKYEMPQDVLETFVKELGAPVEATAKYKVKNPQSLPDTLTVIELTRTA